MHAKRFCPIWAALFILWAAATFFGATESSAGSPESISTEKRSDALEKTWGIRIEGLRQSAGGYMLDFRYRVMDPEKAAPLFDRQTKPYLIDHASGKKFQVPNPPKVGPLRSSNTPQADRVYAVFFGNPGRYIQKGSEVTVVIGELKADNLVVQ